MTISIIAYVKHDELYIKEWLDYHISCGVDHFYLCDNNESDYEIQLQDVIQDYINNGTVDIIDYKDQNNILHICYNDVWQEYSNNYDWWLLINIDEFLTIPLYENNVKFYLELIDDNVGLICANERIYGDNNLIEYDEYTDTSCLERFTMPALTYSIDGQLLINNGQSIFTSPFIRSKSYYDDLNINLEVSKSLNSIICYKEEYLEELRNKKESENEIEELEETESESTEEVLPENKFKCLCIDTVFNTYSNNEVTMNVFNNIESLYVYDYIYNTCFIKRFYTRTIDEFIVKHRRIIDLINNKDLLTLYNENFVINEIYPYTLVDFFNINELTFEKLDFIKEKYNIEYIN